MRTRNKIVLAYLLAITGAGAWSYWRQRRAIAAIDDPPLAPPIDYRAVAKDALLFGFAGGTALSVGVWLSALKNPQAAITSTANPSFFERAVALMNGAVGMGNMSKDAIRLLSQVDVATLYKPFKKQGVTVGPVPVDEDIIDLDRS